MKRPCIVPRCPELVSSGSRCALHRKAQQRQYSATRPTTTQRGYGTQHRQVRQALAATLPAPCGYCGVYIHPGERWDAAHVVDGHPAFGYVVAHPTCNQRVRGVSRNLAS